MQLIHDQCIASEPGAGGPAGTRQQGSFCQGLAQQAHRVALLGLIRQVTGVAQHVGPRHNAVVEDCP